MHNPIATYRIQFHKGFTFENFKAILPYLQKLGAGTIYASPIIEATPGSMHGYDGVNPHRINPEIGTEEELKSISKTLRDYKIGWLQDIAPNHMAYHPNNAWLMDVLEKGKDSPYAGFFDISWSARVSKGRLMVPFLGSPLEECINKDEIKLAYEKEKFVLKYYDTAYPVDQKSVSDICSPDETIEASIERINSNKDLLLRVAESQHYILCHWKETDRQINYRRFFTVNSLICLNIHEQETFEEYHEFILSLLKEGVFQGLRIDHIDGLFNPTTYLNEIREAAGADCYIVVEKILEQGESLPKQWPIQGNTGYDFLSMVNNLFTRAESSYDFTEFYEKLIEDKRSVHEQTAEKKAYILYNHMQGELENLYQLFKELKLAEEANLEAGQIKQAIGEMLIHCPVYRYYGNSLPLEEEEAAAIKKILDFVSKNKEELTPAIKILESILLIKPNENNEDFNKRALRFYQRCMQFSGPLMAKGVEDTLMYTYNRFIGHNEVGDSPENFGLSCGDFHHAMKERQQRWPFSLNATATHDTKRGEDVRARLNALTDIKKEWFTAVEEWYKLNSRIQEKGAPDINDEYFIYQSLIGAYPMPGDDENDFKDRFTAYLIKALREAKRNTNWTEPNEPYEEATKEFVNKLLDKQSDFWKSFQQLHSKVAGYGIIYSLAQTILKFTCPGIPDIYQGCELWDLSFVDPDNRRPVNYEQRQQCLETIITQNRPKEETLQELWENRFNATIKLWLVHTLLQERRQQQELFSQGEYIPLDVTGEYGKNILSFARRHNNSWYIIIVPLHLASLCKDQGKDAGLPDWKDTSVILPGDAPAAWEHIFFNKTISGEREIRVKDIFQIIPMGVLKAWK